MIGAPLERSVFDDLEWIDSLAPGIIAVRCPEGPQGFTHVTGALLQIWQETGASPAGAGQLGRDAQDTTTLGAILLGDGRYCRIVPGSRVLATRQAGGRVVPHHDFPVTRQGWQLYWRRRFAPSSRNTRLGEKVQAAGLFLFQHTKQRHSGCLIPESSPAGHALRRWDDPHRTQKSDILRRFLPTR